MSVIITGSTLRFNELGLSPSSSYTHTPYESRANAFAGRLAAGETSVGYGEIITPRNVFVYNRGGGGSLRVGFATGVYFMRLNKDESVSIPLEVDSLRNTSQIVCAVPTPDDTIEIRMTGDAILRIWLREDGAGTDPGVPGGGERIIADYVTTPAATALSIMTAVKAALDAHGYFITTGDGVDTLTVVDRHTGTRSAAGGTSGFTITNPQVGAASPSVFVLPAGDVDASFIVTPN